MVMAPGPARAAPPVYYDAPRAQRRPRAPRPGITIPPASERRFVPDEVVLEFNPGLTAASISQVVARHRLQQLESQNLPLSNTTYLRARITDGRSVRAVLRSLAGESQLRSGQPNFVYTLSEDTLVADGPAAAEAAPVQSAADTTAPAAVPTPAEAPAPAAPPVADVPAGDPAQYALTKLHLSEAHRLARGESVLVAIVDSGVDTDHPEIKSAIAGTYDALGKGLAPHKHGTGIAGAIAAHARLMGVAPAARILAIQAFGVVGVSAEGTTFAILKGIDYAARNGAKVINMSFAGPADPGLSRQLAAAQAKGIVLVAASGNLGPKSPPQYPSADPNVIAVSATDADDNLFKASNRGKHIAVSAPGVDILLPAPETDYQVTSGTSFAAAEVSGIAALLLSRQPSLSPGAVRRLLMSTAKDLGPKGVDDQFGAGLVNAYSAVQALTPAVATRPPTAAASR